MKYNISKDFQFETIMEDEFANGTLGKKWGGIRGELIGAAASFLAGCSYHYTTSGSSAFGVPCRWGGCLEISC